MNGEKLFALAAELAGAPETLARMGEAARRSRGPARRARAAEILEEAAAQAVRFRLTRRRKPKQYGKEMFFRPQHFHFTGIGGIGMSGIAEVLLNLGYQISGSDLKLSAHHRTAGRAWARGSSKGHARTTSPAPRAGGELRGGRAEPRSAGGAAAADPGDSARRAAGRADAPEVRHRHRRQPRQDHHHLDGRRHPQPRRA